MKRPTHQTGKHKIRVLQKKIHPPVIIFSVIFTVEALGTRTPPSAAEWETIKEIRMNVRMWAVVTTSWATAVGTAGFAGCTSIVGVDGDYVLLDSQPPDLGFGGNGSSGTDGGGGGTGGGGGDGGGNGGTDEPVPLCGNGIIESGERCDDGNNFDGDVCTSDCTCGGSLSDVFLAFRGPTPQGHCYVVSKNPDVGTEVSLFCSGQNMSNAVITDADELAFVTQNFSDSLWLGASDEQVEGTWEWYAQEAWLIKPCDIGLSGCNNNIDLWNMGEPDDVMNQDCLASNYGKFSDRACTDLRQMLCESL